MSTKILTVLAISAGFISAAQHCPVLTLKNIANGAMKITLKLEDGNKIHVDLPAKDEKKVAATYCMTSDTSTKRGVRKITAVSLVNGHKRSMTVPTAKKNKDVTITIGERIEQVAVPAAFGYMDTKEEMVPDIRL